MLAVLTRALAEKAREIARLETGHDVDFRMPQGTMNFVAGEGIRYDESATAEFRFKIGGPTATVYVVTVSEVRAL